jgi:hypothetical protein
MQIATTIGVADIASEVLNEDWLTMPTLCRGHGTSLSPPVTPVAYGRAYAVPLASRRVTYSWLILVSEQEFLRIQKSPVHIFPGLAFVHRAINVLQGDADISFAWRPGER